MRKPWQPKDADKAYMDVVEAPLAQFYWYRHKWFRVLYRPLIHLTSKEYRFHRFSLLSEKKRMKKVQKWSMQYRVKPDFPHVTLNEVVGRDTEKSVLLTSVHYWVLRDPKLREQLKNPPPKVFCVKGASGTGKTFLVKAIQREAFERGLKDGYIVNPKVIMASEIYTMWYGESSRKVAQMLNEVIATPTVCLIDEAQNFAKKGGRWEQASDESGEDQKVQGTILQKIDLLQAKDFRSIIIFSTDKYESLLETIRRRSAILDLDLGITRPMLLELINRQCAKYHIEGFEDEKILQKMEEAFRTRGHTQVVPDNIIKTFQYLVEEKEKPIHESMFKSGEAAKLEPPKYEYNDFAKIIPKVIAYTEREMTASAKEAHQMVKSWERYKDIGGLHDVKPNVIKEIMLAMDADQARKVGYRPPKGFLFHGPPGTGKTLLAKAIANENQVNFFLVKGPSLMTGLVGESEKGVRDVFANAKKHAPSILFLDEIDALAPIRGSRFGDAGVSQTVTAALLAELDGFNPLGNVVVIGATNRLDIIDPGVKDRLSRQFEFPYPKSVEEKREVLAVHLGYVKEHLHDEVTTDSAMKIFLQKTFSPRIIADVVLDANSLRAKEIQATMKLVDAVSGMFPEKIKDIRLAWKDEFTRIQQILALNKTVNNNEKDLHGVYANITPEKWKIRLFHLEKAFEKKAETDEMRELRQMQAIYRSGQPEVGKTFGLATDSEGQTGMVLPIECQIFPAIKKNEGVIEVYGTVNESIKESARIGRTYLRKHCLNIMDFDIYVHMLSPSEGVDIDTQKASGPSAGMAILMAMISALTKTPASPNICMTGKVSMNGKAGLVGGIQPKRGAGKLDAAREEKFQKIIIPQIGYQNLWKDFKDYVKMSKELGTEIVGAVDEEDYSKHVFPDVSHDELVKRLKELK